MKISPSNVLLVSTGLIAGMALTLTGLVSADRSDQVTLPRAELRAFTDVFGRIKASYVEEVDDKTLIDNAISGMLSGLDPHSAYLNADAFKDLRVDTSGQFGGLGIEVGMENGFVKVVAPIDDTPAANAGVKAGDLIIRLDDQPVKGMSLTDAVKLMRGVPGSDIVLTIVREGADKPLKITITRAIIRVKSVKTKALEPGYGYVRISQFQEKTGDGLRRTVDKIREANDGQLHGLILDLRNNPGGVLTAAVDVSDAFLNDGLIVYTEGRENSSKLSYKATPGDILDGAPLVVLVNGGSASASEIVSGALKDHGRALIVGSKTFGKGSVQTIIQLQGNSAIKLTTARYYTPSGVSIQAKGIEPDIHLAALKVDKAEDFSALRVKERDLAGHLDDGSGKPQPEHGATKDKGKTKGAKGDKDVDLAKRDYQLYEALNLLKGIYLSQQAGKR